MKLDVNFFPGWVRKSITFTIDDGNLTLDRKFMDYVKPAGIRGTFNLTTPLSRSFGADGYRRQYEGYEIDNHCRYHAYPFHDDETYTLSKEPFDPATADPKLIYKTDEEGIFRIHTYGWCFLADDKRYMECVDKCTEELEAVFGKGSIRGYVWPCGSQNNKKVTEQLKTHGFQSIRATGCVKDSTGFSMPADRNTWSYNAKDDCLNEVARLYEKQPDDGTLKFFCFGVHAHDFENHGTWGELASFCETYGNRPDTYWYAGIHEIFDYEDAVKSIILSETEIRNPSRTDLYIKIGGEKRILKAGKSITLS